MDTIADDSKLSSYQDLKSWLLEEIGNIPISTMQKCGLPKSLQYIKNLSEEEANLALKKHYINNFMSKKDYERQVEFLSQTETRETRLKIRSPLPSTDFAILLKSDPKLSYLQRAASLAHAALALHLRFKSKKLYTALSQKNNRSNCSIYNNIFATSVIPKAKDSYVNLNKDSDYINIFFRGRPYTLQVINDGKATSPEVIFHALQELVANNSTRDESFIGLLRSIPLDLMYEKYKNLQQQPLEVLHGAIFTLCLDTVPTTDMETAPSLNKLFTEIFSGNRQNRWYGSTQIVVRTDGEAALLFSYMCGVDGVQANEVTDELFKATQHIHWQKTMTGLVQSSVCDTGLLLGPEVIVELRRASDPLFHNQPSVHTLPLGLNYFKEIELSPNIAIHFLLMLAFKDAGELEFLPETSQAIIVREQLWGGAQLDWLRARPDIIRRFLTEKNTLPLFRQAIDEHKKLIRRSRQSFSPFLFFDNPLKGKDDELIRFYLSLGKEEVAGAYRHYLCPITRDPAALDIITSSLRLWDGIELIGRPGTRSKLVNMAGTHVLFDTEETHIVFTPTELWEDKLTLIRDHMLKWMRCLSSPTGLNKK